MGESISTLASVYLNNPGIVPSDNELSTFRAWLHTEFSKIPAKFMITRQDFSLEQTKQRYIQTGEIITSLVGIEHPFFTFIENIRFRALHDWHHIITGSDSNFDGELRAYEIALATAPEAIHWILRSEIVLQAAAMLQTGAYQEQKLVRA